MVDTWFRGCSSVLETSVGHFWRESFGQLYPTLRRLEENGLLSSRPAPSISGPERNLHTLTADGWKMLRDWLAQPADIHEMRRDETLLKVFSAGTPVHPLQLTTSDDAGNCSTASSEPTNGSSVTSPRTPHPIGPTG